MDVFPCYSAQAKEVNVSQWGVITGTAELELVCVSVSVCVCVCVQPADVFAGCCLTSSAVFERLVEVKPLSVPGLRECTDERPLHHPNGLHKPLNQHHGCCCGCCCHGIIWVSQRVGGGRGGRAREQRVLLGHTRPGA